MAARELPAKIKEWLLRSEALRAARAQYSPPDGQRQLAGRQARLLVEAARRIAEPVDALPPGSQPAVLLPLFREATYWALAARAPDFADVPAAPATRIKTDADKLRAAASAGSARKAVVQILGDVPEIGSLDATRADVARARAVAEDLVWDLDEPQRRIDRLLLRRWSNLALVAIVALGVGYGVHRLSLGPNLAAGKSFRVSSSAGGCEVGGTCDALFHTNSQNSPWVEYDLGALKPFKRIEVTNRGDCCQERAVPLIAEVSADAVHWREVAKRDKEFSTWTATFPRVTARYVRLRIPAQGVLHLKAVAVR